MESICNFFMKPCIYPFLLFYLSITIGGCSVSRDAVDYSRTIHEMTPYIESYLAQNGVTGLSIALVDGQRVVWAQGFGYADRQAGRPADADTIYEIASTSKTFAAMAILRLVEEGRIDIDQPLSAYLPGFAVKQRFAESAPITIRSILTHHSGIPSDLFNGVFTYTGPFDYNAWLLDYLKNDYTAFPVNFARSYSNPAFALLSSVIDNVSPGGFNRYMNNLFDLMGMSTTSFNLDDRIPRDKLSKGYLAGGVAGPLLYINESTAGSIRSSVMDMARYIKMINAGGLAWGGQIVSSQTLEQMFTWQNGNVPLDFDERIGLTWFLGALGDYAGRRVWHDGLCPEFGSRIEILTDHQLGVIVLANGPLSDLSPITANVLKYALKDKQGIDSPPAFVPAYSPPDMTWTSNQFQALAGNYVIHNSRGKIAILKVAADQEGLLLRIGDNWTRFIPRQNGYFSQPDGVAEAQGNQLRFEVVSGRSIISYYNNGKKEVYAERDDQGVIPSSWLARLGAYKMTNLVPDSVAALASLSLTVVDNILFADDSGMHRGPAPIKPFSDTVAFIPGIGRNCGESVRVVRVDGEEQIEIWGYRFRRTGP